MPVRGASSRVSVQLADKTGPGGAVGVVGSLRCHSERIQFRNRFTRSLADKTGPGGAVGVVGSLCCHSERLWFGNRAS
ncbi:hypothetical protein U1Q18_050010 [Sarracenia purpurea var. burkii]